MGLLTPGTPISPLWEDEGQAPPQGLHGPTWPSPADNTPSLTSHPLPLIFYAPDSQAFSLFLHKSTRFPTSGHLEFPLPGKPYP